MIIAGIIIGSVIALLGGLGVLTRTVFTLSGKIENGLTDDVREIKLEQLRAREEQDRQGARIDSLYNHLIGD